MIIYVVTSGTYSDYKIDSLYTNKEKAEERLAALKKVDMFDNEKPQIEEWPVDQEFEEIPRQYWMSEIDLVTGQVFEPDAEVRYRFAKPNQRTYEHANQLRCLSYGGISERYTANSFVSQEHADKLAVEARQLFLRTIDFDKIERKERIGVRGNVIGYSYTYPDETINFWEMDLVPVVE